jgi:hypothetical protein
MTWCSQILFIQTRWYWLTIVTVTISILLWWMTASAVSLTIRMDFDWFGVSRFAVIEYFTIKCFVGSGIHRFDVTTRILVNFGADGNCYFCKRCVRYRIGPKF